MSASFESTFSNERGRTAWYADAANTRKSSDERNLFSSLYKNAGACPAFLCFSAGLRPENDCMPGKTGDTKRIAAKKDGLMAVFFQLVEKDPALQRASFSRSVSGIKKASFARFFDTTNSIGSVVPIERLSKTMFSTASKTALWPSFFASKRQRIVLARLHRTHVLP